MATNRLLLNRLFLIKYFHKMVSVEKNLPTTQSALQWVRVSDTNPFEWTTSAPIINPSELGDNQVLIENHAVSLNPVDYKMAARNFAQTKLPAVTGYDVSGRVVAVGKGVKDFKVGDEVFGLLNLNSSNGGGALQQYSVGEADTLIKKPANISHTDAATLGTAFLSAMVGFLNSLKDNNVLLLYRMDFVKLILIHLHLCLFLVGQVVLVILVYKLLKFEVLNK
jgi:NADPH:quinone reductase-like Zn-dependent oxidoreductase